VPAELSGQFTLDSVLTDYKGYVWASSTNAANWPLPLRKDVSYFPSGYFSFNDNYYKADIVAKPPYPANSSPAGWTNINQNLRGTLTPLNPNTVVKNRIRYGLSALNAHVIGSLATTPAAGINSSFPGFVVTFDPPIATKTASKVFEIEGYIELVRV
jgi:hypothetical protein